MAVDGESGAGAHSSSECAGILAQREVVFSNEYLVRTVRERLLTGLCAAQRKRWFGHGALQRTDQPDAPLKIFNGPYERTA